MAVNDCVMPPIKEILVVVSGVRPHSVSPYHLCPTCKCQWNPFQFLILTPDNNSSCERRPEFYQCLTLPVKSYLLGGFSCEYTGISWFLFLRLFRQNRFCQFWAILTPPSVNFAASLLLIASLHLVQSISLFHVNDRT